MLEEKANRGVATPTSTVVGTASAFLAFISSGGQSTRVDQNWSKAFGKEIRLSLRRAILAIREAESKESAKNAQTKNNGLKCFLSFLSQSVPGFVIRFFHGIFFPFAYRLIAECQINARSLRAAAIVPAKGPKKTSR
jgi:hypothetical protein